MIGVSRISPARAIDTGVMRAVGRRTHPFAPVALSLVTAMAVVAVACASAANPRVVLYGDSLGQEASGPLAEKLEDHAEFESAAVGGLALCDSLLRIRSDLQRGRTPTYALIQFSGNNISRCMQQADGRPLEGDELAAKYATDTETAVRLLRSAGVEVYLIGSPSAALTSGAEAVNAGFRRVARQWSDDGGVHYVDAGVAVSPQDTYTPTLPCLKFETSEFGCEEGRIPVRAPDGNHFCPPGIEGSGTPECPVWSSGAYRFAEAMAEPVLSNL